MATPGLIEPTLTHGYMVNHPEWAVSLNDEGTYGWVVLWHIYPNESGSIGTYITGNRLQRWLNGSTDPWMQ